MQNQNTILEDISAEIGYTATSTLCGWYGGRWLRVPINPVEGHQISAIIGQKQFRVLVASFGGECIFVPKDRAHNLTRRNRVVFDMLMRGSNVDSVAARVNCSPRWVKNIRRTLEDAGLLPLVLKEPSDTD